MLFKYCTSTCTLSTGYALTTICIEYAVLSTGPGNIQVLVRRHAGSQCSNPYNKHCKYREGRAGPTVSPTGISIISITRFIST